MQRNSFIYNENATIGQVKMVEGAGNTTQIYKLKDEGTPVYTLDAPWWDLDGINRAVKKNEKAIAKAVKTCIINGCVGLVDTLSEKMKELSADERHRIKLYAKEKMGLR
jgi:hypothetical protein